MTMSPGIILLLLAIFLCASDADAASPGDGFIHGTVTWPSGETLTGFIRWESEEAFWDDIFQSGYRENPWRQFVDLEALRAVRRKEYYDSHGLLDRLFYAKNEDDKDPIGWRMFQLRYGDMVRIEINDGQDDFVTTADGSRHQIGGYGNDDGADLLVYSGDDEPVEIDWNDLAGIEFSAAPTGAKPYGRRMYGLVQTTRGDFEGYIQWDKSECVSVDILDGRFEGRNKDIPLGEVRSIARAEKQNASVIELTDGSSLTMGGSNDLDRGNRGIMVENPAWGRVTIPWKHFRQVTFSEGKGSGPARDTYQNGAPLEGTVVLKDGTALSGRLVFDLDEGWHWDLFNGIWQDLEYHIPFPLVAEIEPADQDICRLVLRSGLELELSETQDTGEKNGGILIFSGADPAARHVLWPEVRKITLDP
jgi:hypothetical protein